MGETNLTKIGLWFLIIGQILVLISVISFFATNGSIIALSYLSIVGGLLAFIALIIMIVGGLGLKEYGKKHGTFTLIALIIWIIGFVITLIIGFMVVFFVISAAFPSLSSSQSFTIELGSLRNLVYTAPISTVLGGLMYLFLLYKLENKIGKIILFLMFIIAIISSIIVTYFGLQTFDQSLGSVTITVTPYMTSTELTTQLQSYIDSFNVEISKIGMYGIATNVLILVTLIIPIWRIQTGDLKKVPKETTSVLQPDSVNNIKINCPKCGAKNNQESKFCESCGEILK